MMHAFGLPPLRHIKEFNAYIENGRQVRATAKATKRTEYNIKTWRDDEYWDDYADNIATQMVAETLAPALAASSKAALAKASTLAVGWLDTAFKLKQHLDRKIDECADTIHDVEKARKAAATALDMNDKLHSWSTVNLNINGKLDIITNAGVIKQRLIDNGLLHEDYQTEATA